MTDPEFKSPWDPENHRPPSSGGGSSGNGPSFWKMYKWVIIPIVAVCVLLWMLPDFSLSGDRGAALIYDLLLLAMVGSGLIVHIRSNPGQALRNIAGWVIILGILALGYSIWTGSGRLGQELNPAAGQVANGSISFPATAGSHYLLRVQVNGEPVNFMLDTGASDVILTARDARQAGIDPDRLSYSHPYDTANGRNFGARVVIAEMSLGPIQLENVRASVIRDGLDQSLLGMSFLDRLSAYQVKDNILTLFP
ncbi:retropepsin-like aspartic protease family protein [Emcibacter sp.]|uniref:retropepsin-like aspartic protease family protein n=1 Tax=Emcibacter sp. TaxID=1979954 RepID=UPI002AA7C80F|nr:TIGR02281 family clan AA aspartic protease [Emcibacter sp.]